MSRENMDLCLRAFQTGGFETMDITDGSPEMNPNLEYLITEASKLGNVIVRTNLVILRNENICSKTDTYLCTVL